MFEESSSLFSSGTAKIKSKCKTFESSSPPEYRGNSVTFIDSKTGAKIELEKNRISGFRRVEKDGSETFKVKVCSR